VTASGKQAGMPPVPPLPDDVLLVLLVVLLVLLVVLVPPVPPMPPVFAAGAGRPSSRLERAPHAAMAHASEARIHR
jgi:hypothetical protein